jgi:hypothetical protein
MILARHCMLNEILVRTPITSHARTQDKRNFTGASRT